jgi:hypothetical protein
MQKGGTWAMKRRITRIRVQTEREVIFTSGIEAGSAWCVRCGNPVPLVNRSQAAKLLAPDSPDALLDRDGIHLVEVAKGRFLICLESLQDHTNLNDQN